MKFSFFKSNIKNIYSTKEICLTDLFEMVSDESKGETFQYLRQLKISDEIKYKTEKRRILPYITPACTLKIRALDKQEDFENNFIGFSQYVYFDLDGVENPTDTLKEITEKYPTVFAFGCISPSGKGVSLLIQVDCHIQSNLQYNWLWYHLAEKFFAGYKIDESVKDLGRAMFISYDPNPYLKMDNIVHINGVPPLENNNFENLSTTLAHRKPSTIEQYNEDYFRNIPIDEVFSNLIFRTPVKVSKPLIDVFPIDYVDGSVFFALKDGVKRNTFIHLIHTLCYLNPDIHPSYIFNYLSYLNQKHANPKMELGKLKELFSFVYESIQNDPHYRFKGLRTKNIHFNKNIPLTKDQKSSIANKLNGFLKSNSSIEKIEDAKELLRNSEIKVTQKNIVKFGKISLGTVKRYYRVEEKENIGFWVDFYNSEDFLESLGYKPSVKYKIDTQSFENEMWFHPTCPKYVIEYYEKKWLRECA